MNIIRKVGEARRREKVEKKRARREARRKLKNDATQAGPAKSALDYALVMRAYPPRAAALWA